MPQATTSSVRQMNKFIFSILALIPLFLLGEESKLDSLIREDLQSIQQSPTKRIWEIEYKEDTHGSPDSKAWFVKGTPGRIRIHRPSCGVENLNTSKIYEIDAIALAQHYGVVDFYVYGNPKPKK